jgi:hypothetical protein
MRPTHRLNKLHVSALLLALFAGVFHPAIAQGQTSGAQSQPTTFDDRLKYSRAIEAAIWARPLVGFKAMMDGLQRDAGVGPN